MNLKKVVSVILILIIEISACDGLNILTVLSYFQKSHYFVVEPILKELSKKGHNITVIVNTEVAPNSDYRVINIADETTNEMVSMDTLSGSRTNQFYRPRAQAEASKMCCLRLGSEEIQSFLKENITFDLILAEIFNTNCFLGLAKIHQAPIVGFTSTDLLPWMYQWFGSPENPSYIPVLFMDYHDQLNFFQRVENTLMLLYSKLVHRYYIAPSGNEFSKKYLGVDLYEGGDVMYNISLLLVNRHHSFQTPKPISPNIIEVGGIHLETPKKLPQDIETVVESSPHGVIVISMGSTLKGTTFPIEQRKIFLKVLSQLKQTVIWKWENSTMDEMPENVKIYKWLPQLDLLCNPNVKLFITHGGLLGSQEAVYCAVPMLMLPQFADQHYNAAALTKSGAALKLKLRSVTEKSLSEAIHKALTPEFVKNAKALSERFKDRPMSPMETAIYWIEYVARHNGAPFMKTAVTDMPFYQYLLLDVVSFLTLLLVVFVYISYFLVKVVVRVLLYNRPLLKLKTS